MGWSVPVAPVWQYPVLLKMEPEVEGPWKLVQAAMM